MKRKQTEGKTNRRENGGSEEETGDANRATKQWELLVEVTEDVSQRGQESWMQIKLWKGLGGIWRQWHGVVQEDVPLAECRAAIQTAKDAFEAGVDGELGEQGLPDRVVHLVRTRVVEILPFEKHARAAHRSR